MIKKPDKYVGFNYWDGITINENYLDRLETQLAEANAKPKAERYCHQFDREGRICGMEINSAGMWVRYSDIAGE